MSRIQPINYEQANGKAKQLLDAVKAKLGLTPNMMKTIAQSPAVLEGYLNFSDALGSGTLNAGLREQIALISAEANGCSYCASAHTVIGKMVDLNEEAILDARQARATEAKTDATLKFARQIIVNRDAISDEELQTVRDAGISDGELAEIIANVALNIFTNYFNEIAKTEIDFPKIQIGLTA
jgi:uncharacterized peroxidase-related enzyme